MASIAGSTMIGYAALGVPVEYLLAASLMAIPGGILFARLLARQRNLRRFPLITSLSPKHRQKALLKPLRQGQ
ncbi:putative nucleoside transporter [Escherichia coli]|uniref:Putative nucleoside transporter n=1 Tax=Escherichia coli TaxID=562 RepID=A0A377B816_ECOLX|nr:putative nucleoside transporter [Escherichia coli]